MVFPKLVPHCEGPFQVAQALSRRKALEGLYLPHILASSGNKSLSQGRIPEDEASRTTLSGQTLPMFSLPDVVWG